MIKLPVYFRSERQTMQGSTNYDARYSLTFLRMTLFGKRLWHAAGRLHTESTCSKLAKNNDCCHQTSETFLPHIPTCHFQVVCDRSEANDSVNRCLDGSLLWRTSKFPRGCPYWSRNIFRFLTHTQLIPLTVGLYVQHEQKGKWIQMTKEKLN